MDKSILLQIHQKQIKENVKNEDKTEEIVQILGGIDNVLTLLLSSNDINISNDKLSQIHNTITSNQYNSIKNKEKQLTYYFYANNTYLHSIFGNKNGQKLYNLLYSKYGWIFL